VFYKVISLFGFHISTQQLQNIDTTSSNTTIVIKSRRMRWTSMWLTWERKEEHTGFWRKNTRKTDHLEDLGVDGRIILKSIFKK